MPTKRFLGFDIVRDRENKTVFISQQRYTESIIKKFGFDNLHPVKTPWPPKFELPKTWEPLLHEVKPYIKTTGSLNFLSTGTRPDITFTVFKLMEANSGPSNEHLQLLKHLFRYLIGTKTLGILYSGNQHALNPLTYADASLANDLMNRYSTGGHVMFVAGGPVLWKSKKQTFVALSSTEAEFTNLTPAGLSAQWISKIMVEFGTQQPTPLLLFTDSAKRPGKRDESI